MPSFQLFIAVSLATTVAVMGNNCWQNTITIHYDIGPAHYTLPQSEANRVMGEVYSATIPKLVACSGLSLMKIKATITSPSGKYAIVCQFGVLYGNMGASQKQAAFRCLGTQQIYSETILNPETATNPIDVDKYPSSASQSNSQDAICVSPTAVSSSSMAATPSPVYPSSTVTVVSFTWPSSTSSSPSASVHSTLIQSLPSSPPVVTPVTSSTQALSNTSSVQPSTTSPPTTVAPTAPPTTVAPTASPLYVLKCYKISVEVLYNIPQHISLGQLYYFVTTPKLIGMLNQLLQIQPSCNTVQGSLDNATLSRQQNGSVVLVVSLKLSVTSSDYVSRLNTCMKDLNNLFNPAFLQNVSLPLTLGISTFYEKESIVVRPVQSCCGAIQPPCCPGNAIRISKELCGYLNATAWPMPTSSSPLASVVITTLPSSTPVGIPTTSFTQYVSKTSTSRPFPTSSAVPQSTAAPTYSPTFAHTTAPPTFNVLKCYKLSLELLYNIPQHVSLGQLNYLVPIRKLIGMLNNLLQLQSSCKTIQGSLDNATHSRLQNGSVLLVVSLKLSVTSSDYDNVASRLATCLKDLNNVFNPAYLQMLSLPLTLGISNYEKESIVIHQAQSCCGAIQPPCCPGNAIKKSKEICAYLSFDKFFNETQQKLGAKMMAPCTVFTDANVQVSWIQNGNTIKTTGNDKSQTLIIDKVQTTDAGQYICQVKNEFQVITRTMNLAVTVEQTVDMKLTLKGIPFDPDLRNKTSLRYINMEQDVKTQLTSALSTKINGFKYVVINGFSQGSVVVDFEVLVSKILMSASPSPPDLGSQVIAVMIDEAKKGTLGNLTVGSLVLKVKPPPPSSLTVTELGTTFATISWRHPNGAYQINKYLIELRYQNQQLVNTITVGGDLNYKRFTKLKTNTKYVVQIVSRSAMGDGIPSVLLSFTTLTVKPIIANNGQTFTATAGHSVVLVCSGSSDPGPDIVTWSRQPDLAKITTNTTNNGKVFNTYMVIKNVTEDDSGSYPCTAKHGGVSKDGAVNLVVKVPVVVRLNLTLTNRSFTESLKNKSTQDYKKLETRFVNTCNDLYSNVTGFQRCEVLGFENGSIKVRFRVIVTVKIAKPEDKTKRGQAKAEATNRIIRQVKSNDGELGNGLTVKKGSIQTDAPPNPPQNVVVFDIKENTAHLRWEKPLYAEYFTVSHYQVKLKKHGDTFNWENEVETGSYQLDCPLKKLHDKTGYKVKVFARSGKRLGVESEPQEFNTKESKTSLKWLWVLLPLAAALIIAVAVFYYKKQKARRLRGVYDVNGNRPASTEMEKTCYGAPRIFSYTNNSYAFESLGIMPGKWWEIPRESLDFKETLGSGAFGIVQKAQLDIEDGYMTCAVKMLQKTACEEDQRDMLQELQTMDTIGRHPNLINLIGACTSNGPIMIVLEFAEKGSLIDYLKSHVEFADGDKICTLSEEEKLTIGLDIAMGMRHLASVKCVHRDLAARNVLLSGDGRAKISDFGLSRDVYERGFYEKTTQGKLPVRWMAPEAIQQMLFTTQSDVWSFGVVLWEIESGGKVPYAGQEMKELIDYLKKGFRLQQPSACKQKTYELMLHCWNNIQARRPSFGELCSKLEGRLALQS